MRTSLRPWRIKDAEYLLYLRNHPHLMRWFRQDKEITLEEQKAFMREGAKKIGYVGYMVVADDRPVGFVALSHINKDRRCAEFSIGIDPVFSGQGIGTEALKRLEWMAKQQHDVSILYSDVFCDNPALGMYLRDGFLCYGVREDYAYKKGIGLVDAVRIKKSL
jgi:RimJ/RimL family protein N-acetyltransferase